MAKSSNKPIGVVVPAFGHPKFLAEAVISACEQDIDQPVKVVVVDDGCRFSETGEIVQSLLDVYPGKLFYLRQENTRLPGARNTGIRFLMDLEPEMEALFFLDADNRLSPYSLSAFRTALGDDPHVGWAYPDITFFGTTATETGMETRETAAQYSRLKHLISNVSEAGSMVRADVLRRGLMFDETMTSGFEDWDFWLSLLGAGYHGVRAPDAGFLYRVRPESMLAESQRVVDTLVAKIRAKHSTLFTPGNIMSWEHQDAPTVALYTPETGMVRLMSDPCLDAQEYTIEAFRQLFHDWAYNQYEHFFPTHVFVASEPVWQLLTENRAYLRWLFWHARDHQNLKQFISFKAGANPTFGILPYGGENPEDRAGLFCVSTDILWQRSQAATDNRKNERAAYWAYVALSLLPDEIDELAANKGETDLEAEFEQLAEALLPLPQYVRHASQKFAGPHSQSIREILIPEICALEGRAPFPACRPVPRILVAIPAEYLEEPNTINDIDNLIRAVQQPDTESILAIEYQGNEVIGHSTYTRLTQIFDDIVPLYLGANNLDTSIYLGKPFQRNLPFEGLNDVGILARTCSDVYSIGASRIIEAFGEIRRHGARAHVIYDRALIKNDSEASFQTKLLAFEHAISHVVTQNPGYLDGMAAEGFPSEKIVSVAEFRK